MVNKVKKFRGGKLPYPILYDNQVMPPKYAYEVVLPFLDELEIGNSFMEVGSGTGIISLFIAFKLKIPVYAMDISKNAIEISNKNAAVWNLNHNISFFYSSIEDYSSLELPMIDTIFSSPPYFINFDKKVKDERYFATPSFFYKLIEFASCHLTTHGSLVCHINSFTTFQFFIKLLQDANFIIKVSILPNILDIRDFLSINEYVLQNLLSQEDGFNFQSHMPRGIGKNTLSIDFNQVLGIEKKQNSGGWIIATKQ